jgi:hypothetical protein
MSELSFFTTQELIAELMRRETFLGVVIHADDEHRGQPWTGARYFNVHFNSNLAQAEVGRLLETVADRMEGAHG